MVEVLWVTVHVWVVSALNSFQCRDTVKWVTGSAFRLYKSCVNYPGRFCFSKLSPNCSNCGEEGGRSMM